MKTKLKREDLMVDRIGQVRRRARNAPGRARGPAGRPLARVEKRPDGWALLTLGKELREGGFRSRNAALDALQGHLEREEAERKRAWEARKRETEARKERAREELKNPRCLLDYADRVAAAAPEGWVAEIEPDALRYGRAEWEVSRVNPDAEREYDRHLDLRGTAATVVLKSEREEIHWRLNLVTRDSYDLSGGAVSVSGSTYFIGARTGGWCCFDRRGISDSFYSGSLTDPAEVVREELERIEKSRAASLNFVDVPGLPYSIRKDRIAEVSEKLKRGGSELFTPHGMGTAHRVSARRPPGKYGVEQLPAVTAEFFGLPALWAEHVDWD